MNFFSKQKSRRDNLRIGSPGPAAVNASAIQIRPVSRGYQAKSLVVFGDFNSGKTWFAKKLLSKLKVVENDIPCGKDNHTAGCVVYSNAQAEPVSSIDGDGQYNVAIYDTEGLRKPSQTSDAGRFIIDRLLFAVTSSVPGIILLVADKFAAEDELLLQIVSGLVGLDRRILVLHNHQNSQIEQFKPLADDLLKNQGIPVTRDETSLEMLSFVNGHTIEHLFLFQHKEANLKHNEKVMKKIIHLLELNRPAVVDDVSAAILAKYTLLNAGYFEFQFFSPVGQISVTFRILSDQEMKARSEDVEMQEMLQRVHNHVMQMQSLSSSIQELANINGSSASASSPSVGSGVKPNNHAQPSTVDDDDKKASANSSDNTKGSSVNDLVHEEKSSTSAYSSAIALSNSDINANEHMVRVLQVRGPIDLQSVRFESLESDSKLRKENLIRLQFQNYRSYVDPLPQKLLVWVPNIVVRAITPRLIKENAAWFFLEVKNSNIGA